MSCSVNLRHVVDMFVPRSIMLDVFWTYLISVVLFHDVFLTYYLSPEVSLRICVFDILNFGSVHLQGDFDMLHRTLVISYGVCFRSFHSTCVFEGHCSMILGKTLNMVQISLHVFDILESRSVILRHVFDILESIHNILRHVFDIWDFISVILLHVFDILESISVILRRVFNMLAFISVILRRVFDSSVSKLTLFTTLVVRN